MNWKGSGLRIFTIFAILISSLLVLTAISTQIALAIAQPFRPGHPVFPLQDFAEQTRAKAIFGETNQAIYFLELALQRTDDLSDLSEGEDALVALIYLDQALDRSIRAVVDAPEQDLSFLSAQLLELIDTIDLALGRTSTDTEELTSILAALQAKLVTVKNLLVNILGEDQVALAMGGEPDIPDPMSGMDDDRPAENPEIKSHDVLFPPGSPGALHEFFPLEGEHAELDCMVCHPSGQYAGTANTCESCHAELTPKEHFSGDCAACHTPYSWQDVNFDHAVAGAQDCLYCHDQEKPEDHYPAQCSACHNTLAWEQVNFNHQAVDTSDCKACHVEEKPSNHYKGQCSACHNTIDWRQANFNHQAAGATDCMNCHAGKKPANHYSAQCSACHNTTNWSNASFNHQAVGASDCRACHKGKKPANHFSGQCSACHNTSTWSGAKFNHGAAGATDCKACHGGVKPANHFDGQCSQCHGTSSWSGASFKHRFPMKHGDADGKCSACHPAGGSKYNCFACHDKEKMQKKHNEEGISNFGSRCLNCHPNGKEDGGGEKDDD